MSVLGSSLRVVAALAIVAFPVAAQRAERLQRVVVQRTRPAPPLLLGRLHGIAHALLLEIGQERGHGRSRASVSRAAR